MQKTKSAVLLSQKSRVGIVLPKEGGWGWVIVFASFMIFMLGFGMILSFEPLLTELSRYFKKSRYETAWVISISFGISFLVGPIVSGLTNKYGCRKVTILGILLMCFGMLVSIPAPNLFYLYVTFGPAVGTGLGMVSLPAVVIVNSYFEKRRAIAVGIAMCGSGIGTLYFPHMIKFLISYYQSWQSTVLILAGIVLNGAVFGALYRKPDIRTIPVESEENENVVIFEPIREIPSSYLQRRYLFEGGHVERTKSEPVLTETKFIKEPIRRAHSNFELGNIELHERESIVRTFLPRRFSSKDKSDLVESKTRTRKTINAVSSVRVTDSQRSRLSEERTVSGLLYRKDIFYSADLAMVPEYRENAPEYYEALVTSVVDIEIQEKKVCFLISREVWDGLKQMMGLSLLKNKACQVILLGRFITCFGLMSPYYYITERAKEEDIPNGTILISIIGISNTFGRVGIGLIANHRSINRILLHKIWVAVCGIMISSISLCSSFVSMSTVCIIYGFTSGGFVAISPVILVDVLGIANLTNAFGLVKLVQGLSYFVAIPIPGLIRDKTGSYSYAFLVCGVFVLLSLTAFCFIPYFGKLERNKKIAKQNLNN